MKKIQRLRDVTRFLFWALSATLMLSLPARATIISGGITGGNCQGGSFVELTPSDTGAPLKVGSDNFDDCNLYAFNEDQNTPILNTDLHVDLLASSGAPGSLAVGTIVASHYVFFDPQGTSSRQTGFVRFDAPVFAILSSSGNLFDSDYLANTNVS